MDYDRIEKQDGAVFHHGKANNRLYLMKWDGKTPAGFLNHEPSRCENSYAKFYQGSGSASGVLHRAGL